MRKFHIAISVSDLQNSITEYSSRLGVDPTLVVPNEYALWRTAFLNFSIRKTSELSGSIRHLGWEDSAAKCFSQDKDCNGIVWELFSEMDQLNEINSVWPDTVKSYSQSPS
jgi:hypothetical protein